MKKGIHLILALAMLTVWIAAAGLASAEDVLMPDMAPAQINTAGGAYWADIADADKILDGGYFSLKLYVQSSYPAEKVEALKPGDKVQVNGQVFTVSELHEAEPELYELIPRESYDGYIVFQKKTDSSYTALVNDWVPCTYVGDLKIMMPLANDFSLSWFGGEDETVLDADGFVNTMSDGFSVQYFNHYNTMVRFEGGLLTGILHTDYPMGPEQE